MATDIISEKLCPVCKTVKPVTEYYPSKHRKIGIRSSCKTCCAQQSKQYIEKIQERNKYREPSTEDRTCTQCDLTKPCSEFYRYSGTASGWSFDCKMCAGKRGRAERLRNRAHRLKKAAHYRTTPAAKSASLRYCRSEKGRHAARVRHYKKKFGLTVEEYAAMLKTQHGACAICRNVPTGAKNLAVDHDHHTGNVRGLLCGLCNTILGRWRDSPDTAKRAYEYLLDHHQLRLVK